MSHPSNSGNRIAALNPARTAVLALDLQRHMVHADSPLARAIGFADQVLERNLIAQANRTLQAARDAGIFVAFVGVDLSPSPFRYPLRGDFCRAVTHEQAEGHVLRPGNWEHALHEDVVRLPSEPIIYKRHISAFAGSGLSELLAERGIEDIVLLGVATTFVVTGTAWAAVTQGIGVTVLEDACAASTRDAHDNAIQSLRAVADIWTVNDFLNATHVAGANA